MTIANKPAQVFPPGDFIREELDARGWTQGDLAAIMGRPIQLVNAIVKGKRAITPQTAQELAAAFPGTGAEVWLNLQATYSLSLRSDTQPDIAERSRIYELAPVKEMQKRLWIPACKTSAELKAKLVRFYGTDDLEKLPQFRVAARASSGVVSDAIPARIAWYCRVKELAKRVAIAPFSLANVKARLGGLRELAAYAPEVRRVPRLLAEMGIALVVVEHLSKSKIDGVSMEADGRYAIGMSLRYDRIDYFWHTLFHEIFHIIYGDPTLDVDIRQATTEASELRADQEAANLLIPAAKLNSFITRVGPFYSKERIHQFAGTIGIHPGIVLGQLQFRREIEYNANREMLEPVRDLLIPTALTDGWGRLVSAG